MFALIIELSTKKFKLFIRISLSINSISALISLMALLSTISILELNKLKFSNSST